MNKTLIWCIIIILMPMGLMLLCILWSRLVDHMFKPTSYNYQQNHSNDTFYRAGPVKKVLMRKHPPCATFFSRVNGEEKQVDGPYEEQWLTAIEKWNWKIRGK